MLLPWDKIIFGVAFLADFKKICEIKSAGKKLFKFPIVWDILISKFSTKYYSVVVENIPSYKKASPDLLVILRRKI